MKKSVGYTVSLNIIVVFIVIVFAFLIGMVGYYKSYKINNIIVESLEKYEGYNDLSEQEISKKLTALGYDQSIIECDRLNVGQLPNGTTNVEAVNNPAEGYCIYFNVNKCLDEEAFEYRGEGVDTEVYNQGNFCTDGMVEEYNYVVKTYMKFNIPIVNKILQIPVYSRTSSIYACYGENC